MIALVLDDCPTRLESVSQWLSGTIAGIVYPFTRDRMLSKTEDRASLSNHCLWKLHQAIRDFKYESQFTQEHNERRFISLAKTYMSRQLIDLQYAANLGIRKPVGGLLSIEAMVSDNDEDWVFEPQDKRQPRPDQIAARNELFDCLIKRFKDGSDERKIIRMMINGYTVEGIARRTGYLVSRVSYLIYHKVQPALRDCLACG